MPPLTIQQAFDLAVQHHQSGQLQQAEQFYRQILAQHPRHADALHMLGVIAHQRGRNHLAVDLIRQAIALNPNFPEAHSNLGIAFGDLAKLDEAIAACQQAIALKPTDAPAHNNLGIFLKDRGELDEAITAWKHAAALTPDNAGIDSAILLTLHFHPAPDAKTISTECHCWNQRHAEPLRKFIHPHQNDPSPHRCLKIGYVSPDFREHAIARFLLPLLAQHDHQHFEIFAYAQVPAPDSVTQELRTHTDHWRNLVGLSDDQAAQLIRNDQIDILIDLAMHSANNRLLLFARKPAPIQLTYLAYCSTTGLTAIDYRLSDPHLDPPTQDQSIYSEKTLHLPDTYWCYHPASTPPITPLPALTANHITFGSLNNFCKITEPTLTTWAHLLHAVPNSQLLLHAPEGQARQRTIQRLQQSGIDPHRLRFTGRLPAQDYLHLYDQIDIALDPFPYGGGTTTCDALWMGVPIITLAGNTAVGRGGVSILSNLGLPELIAITPDEYSQIATTLANDLPRLTALRSTLRERMQKSPLMDAPRFTRNVEALYRQIWQKWCASPSA